MSQKQFVELGPTTIAISIGDGVSLSITKDDYLVVEDAFVRMSLGKATKKRFADLQSYLDQLAIHAVDA